MERCVGLKGLVFCAALVVLVPISVCGDAASARVANPGGDRKVAGGIRREVSHVDLTAERVLPAETPRSLPIGAPRREMSHADINDSKPKLELRSGGGQHWEGGDGHEDCQDDVDWQSQIVYSGEVLGVGSFSVVHAARNISSGQQLAVKIVRIPADNEIFIKRLTREVKILREIDHQNIVHLHKVLESPSTCNMFMERCDGGELFTLLEGMEFSDDGVRSLVVVEGTPPVEFSEGNIVHIMHQILSAVQHCHQRNIVHRDLKLENVLLVNSWADGGRHVKVADFGFAKVLREGEHLISACGSPHYAAPEVILAKETGTGYRFECDMWAVGVICYTLLCCQYPFDGDSDLDVIKKVQRAVFEFPDHVVVSEDAKDFVRKLICLDIRERATADEALRHPWITRLIGEGEAAAASVRPMLEAKLKLAAAKNSALRAEGLSRPTAGAVPIEDPPAMSYGGFW